MKSPRRCGPLFRLLTSHRDLFLLPCRLSQTCVRGCIMSPFGARVRLLRTIPPYHIMARTYDTYSGHAVWTV